jgi:hypothetical protein
MMATLHLEVLVLPRLIKTNRTMLANFRLQARVEKIELLSE